MVWSASYLEENTEDIALARPSGDDRFREAGAILALRPICLK